MSPLARTPARGASVIFSALLATLATAGRARAQSYTPALTLPNPSPAASFGYQGDVFGTSMAAVGGKILVGAPNESESGAAYLFDGTTGALLLTIHDPTPSPGDYFGAEVAGFGTDLLVGERDGSGAAYRFDGTTGALLRTFTGPGGVDPNFPDFNFGLALATMGNTVIIGAPGYTGTPASTWGAVYLFDGTTGSLLGSLANPGVADFGTDIAVDGTRVLVLGAPGAYLYDGPSQTLLHSFVPGGGFSAERQCAFLGNEIVFTARNHMQRVVFVYDAVTGALVRQFDILPASAVFAEHAIATAGGRILVGVSEDVTKGSPDSGSVAIYDSSTGALLETIYSASADPLTNDRFGETIVPSPGGILIAATTAGTGSAKGVGVVYSYDACGNGTRAIGEQCDDGNRLDGDGCSASCKLELCPATPRTGCRKAPATKSRLAFADKQRDVQDSLTWKWTRGAATSAADLGSPSTTTTYALCVYDGSSAPQPLLDLAVLPGAGWQTVAPGTLAYKNTALTPSGVLTLKLKAAPDGSATIALKGKGPRMGRQASPPTAFVTPVTVQLTNSDTGVCWDATYSGTVLHATPDKFVALSDP